MDKMGLTTPAICFRHQAQTWQSPPEYSWPIQTACSEEEENDRRNGDSDDEDAQSSKCGEMFKIYPDMKSNTDYTLKTVVCYAHQMSSTTEV